MIEPNTPCCAEVPEGELKPLGAKEILEHMLQAVKAWKEAGFPLAEDAVYHQRLRICRSCPKNQYQWFQCRHCRCIVYSKAKLATEVCPYGLWP